MSSPAQVLANRRNAALSTGPSTPEGKSHSSKNATRHGLAGVFSPLPHENTGDFEKIAESLRAEFSPGGENENFFVDQMIEARCRLVRIERLETLAYNQALTEPGGPADPDSRVLAALSRSGNALDKLERYRAAATRQYYKALREIQSSRARTHKTEATALDNYIKQVVFAPVPGCREPAVRNEPNSPAHNPHGSIPSHANFSKGQPKLRPNGYPENLALCL